MAPPGEGLQASRGLAQQLPRASEGALSWHHHADRPGARRRARSHPGASPSGHPAAGPGRFPPAGLGRSLGGANAAPGPRCGKPPPGDLKSSFLGSKATHSQFSVPGVPQPPEQPFSLRPAALGTFTCPPRPAPFPGSQVAASFPSPPGSLPHLRPRSADADRCWHPLLCPSATIPRALIPFLRPQGPGSRPRAPTDCSNR